MTTKLIGRLSIIGAAVVTWVVVAGSTGTCPMCSEVLDVFSPRAAVAAPLSADSTSPKKDADPPAREGAPKTDLPVDPVLTTDIMTIDGNKTSLQQFVGKPMVVEVWATWCGPCRKQRTVMTKLAEEMKDEVVFVAVSYDQGGPTGVKNFLSTNPRFEHEFMSTPPFRTAVSAHNRRNAIPKTIYIDRSGKVVEVEIGAHNEEHVRGKIEKLVATTT